MPIDRLALIGAGGHAKIVIDALRASGEIYGRLEVLDESPARCGLPLWDMTISKLEYSQLDGQHFHVCIGSNIFRQKVFALAGQAGAQPKTITHPRAMISGLSAIGAGTFIAAGSVIAPDAMVGDGCIINHNAVVDHDCRVGDFCHVAPGATLGGGVCIGDGVMIGAGANILPLVRIGNNCVIGAGAVVLNDVPDNCVYAGVPARTLGK